MKITTDLIDQLSQLSRLSLPEEEKQAMTAQLEQIVDYMDAAKRLQFTANLDKVYNPSFQSVWIAVNDNQIVEIKGGELKEI